VVEHIGRIETKLKRLRFGELECLAHVRIEIPLRSVFNVKEPRLPWCPRQRILTQANSKAALRHGDRSSSSLRNDLRQADQGAACLQIVLRCDVGALCILYVAYCVSPKKYPFCPFQPTLPFGLSHGPTRKSLPMLDCDPKSLFATEVSFSSLNRDISRQELTLIPIPPSELAQMRTGPPG
jgi:hypothetical protein